MSQDIGLKGIGGDQFEQGEQWQRGLSGSEGARGGGESNDHMFGSWNGPDGVILGGV